MLRILPAAGLPAIASVATASAQAPPARTAVAQPAPVAKRPPKTLHVVSEAEAEVDPSRLVCGAH